MAAITSGSRRSRRIVSAAALAVLLLAACEPLEAVSAAASSADPLPAGRGGDQLDELTVAPEAAVDYERERWPHWREVEGTHNCNARELALRETGSYIGPDGVAQGPTRYDPSNCEVYEPGHPALEGGHNQWTSVYDGKVSTDPGELDADHFVPLEEAAQSGGGAWSADRREAYANEPELVVAVSASSNRSKGSSDPSEWLPPAEDRLCAYAARWIETKMTWHLSVDQAEREALAAALEGC